MLSIAVTSARNSARLN